MDVLDLGLNSNRNQLGPIAVRKLTLYVHVQPIIDAA